MRYRISGNNIFYTKLNLGFYKYFTRKRIFDRSTAVFLFLCFFYCIFVFPLFSYDVDPVGKKIKTGVQKFKTGDYYGSLDAFNEVSPDLKEDERLEFNKGTSYYKLNDYPSAIKHFEKSLSSNNKDLKTRAHYNIGNTLYKQGDKLGAIKSYLDALKISPDFDPARKNLELIRKKEEKQDQKNNSEDNQDTEQKEENKNSPQNQSSKTQNKPQKMNENDLENEKKLSKEEAERILESSRQDQIKRRKLKERKPDYESMFW